MPDLLAVLGVIGEAADLCGRYVGDQTSVYLTGSRSTSAQRADSDIDLVVILPHTLLDARLEVARQLGHAVQSLRARSTSGVLLSMPKLATWEATRACHASDPVIYGQLFWQHAKLLAGRELRDGPLVPDDRVYREAARSALVRAAGSLLCQLAERWRSRIDATLELSAKTLGRLLRALWVLEQGDWIASYSALLALFATQHRGPLAALHRAVAIGGERGIFRANAHAWAEAVDQLLAHLCTAHLSVATPPEAFGLEPGSKQLSPMPQVATGLDAFWDGPWVVYPDDRPLAVVLDQLRLWPGFVSPLPRALARVLVMQGQSAELAWRTLRYLVYNHLGKWMELVTEHARSGYHVRRAERSLRELASAMTVLRAPRSTVDALLEALESANRTSTTTAHTFLLEAWPVVDQEARRALAYARDSESA